MIAKATLAGDHLQKSAHKEPHLLKWNAVGRNHLTGFFHGAAGIALALLKPGSLTDQERFIQAAK